MIAQEARDLLTRKGWWSLCRVRNAEHWVKCGRRIVLHYDGDEPGNVDLDAILHARIETRRNGRQVLVLDEGQN